MVVAMYLFAVRWPLDFSRPQAVILVVLALCVTGSSEYTREMLRKPYLIDGYMYSNGVRLNAVETFSREGYLANTLWVRDAGGGAVAPGEAMFRGQCMSCHTLNGYRPMRRLLAGRDREGVGNFLKVLQEHKPDSPYHAFMPQLVGTAEEIAALGDYLETLVPKTVAALEQKSSP
jgi:mono/diheme cytochrome c family protein